MQLSDAVIAAFLILHVALAAAVTSHALLRKVDVRAAFGWIGLAWLSPGIGVVLYWVFGVNRVSRRATRLRRRSLRPVPRLSLLARTVKSRELLSQVSDIARVSEVSSETPLTTGNAIELLRDGEEAYPAMLAAIRRAERSIALAAYIFRADRIGQDFVAALKDARSRGVEVRVLVDGFGSGYLRSPIARRLAAAGIPTHRFLHFPMPWRMPFLNMRNHKKLLIIDGREGFTGGLNIGDENRLALDPRHPVRDVHFRLTGPVVRQMMTSFAEDWSFATGESLEGELWWPKLDATGPVVARGISSGPDEDAGTLDSILAAAVGAAKRRLRIMTPYFLPDQTLALPITLAAMRGVEVDVLIPARSDYALLDWAMRAHIAFLKVPGLRIHLTPPPFDHSKAVTVDGVWSLIGSANWDVRSSWLNFEFVVECYDDEAARQIDRLLEEKMAAARPVTQAELRSRSTPARLRDAAARLLLPYL